MSWLPLIGAVLLATSLNGSSDIEQEKWKDIGNLVKSKCIKNADIGAFAKLENYSSNYFGLFEDLDFPRHPNYQELVDFTCSELMPRVFTYLTNIAEKLEPCLDLEEKYLLDVMVEVYNSSYTGNCKDGGKVFFDAVKAFKSAKCRKGKFTGYLEIAINCPSTLNLIQHVDDVNYVWVKKDFCIDVKNFHGCVDNYLKIACSNDEKFIEAFNSQYAYLLNSCEGAYT